MTIEIFTKYIDSPLGMIEVSATESYLTSILFVETQKKPSPRKEVTAYIPPIIDEFEQQMKEYFEGTRKGFELAIKHEGTDFQKSVWEN